MNDEVVLITGANRGIGLALTKQYLINGCNVIATCRDDATTTELISLKAQFSDKLLIELMDITCPETIHRLANNLSQRNISLDLIINNAGYLDSNNQSIHAINYADAELSFKVNALGPLFLTHCLLSLLNKSRLCKIAIISSSKGSLSKPQSVDWYGYRMSKAAANMLTVNLSTELADDNVAVVSVHPGWVQTDMGGSAAQENVNDSALGIMQVIANLSIDNTGKFYDFNGEQLPF
ncbi:SDR family oxidoreductase [Shewanella livingstonensis]|uniref:SDR family oxidoreductase n=1 Tax=Shewanella livingstonensis TaxID=150120 RepID=A0A3G8LUD8_9GAMM|nr:SDR family oxidoreductase [Shewanella livingstonensis]AZG73201.1 SDR family oxidoreductase [Shewanella livingstonensis]